MTNISALNVADINGTNGFRINGANLYGAAGRSISSAGDINGDGIDDILLGSPYAVSIGATYVVFGNADGFAADISLSDLNGRNGFRIANFLQEQYIGSAVSSAGDINGDGFDDILIGATGGSRNGGNSGTTYVVFGRAAAFDANFDLSTLNGRDGFRINGEAAGEASGFRVASA